MTEVFLHVGGFTIDRWQGHELFLRIMIGNDEHEGICDFRLAPHMHFSFCVCDIAEQQFMELIEQVKDQRLLGTMDIMDGSLLLLYDQTGSTYADLVAFAALFSQVAAEIAYLKRLVLALEYGPADASDNLLLGHPAGEA